MSKKKPAQKYTPKELYEGYYWLILHTNPFYNQKGQPGEGGYILFRRTFWNSQMPDCVKTATEEGPLSATLIISEPTPGGITKSFVKHLDFTTNIFKWFTSKGIPLFTVEGEDIKCYRGLRKLWGKINVVDSSGKKTPLTGADWFKKANVGEDVYYEHSEDIRYALESYLEPQHKKNLEAVKTQETPASQPGPIERKDKKTPAYQWEFDTEKNEVKCNGSNPVHLDPRLFDLFEYLHRKKKATLKRIRKDLKIEERYNHLIANRVSTLISALDKEAKVLGLKKGEIRRIIERERDGRKLVKVIFHTS